MSHAATVESVTDQNVTRDGVDETVCQVVLHVRPSALDPVLAEVRQRLAAEESVVVTEAMLRAAGFDEVLVELAAQGPA
jgi:hypothetical protein